MKNIRELKQFYEFMFETAIIKRNIVKQYFEDISIDISQIDQLKLFLNTLKEIPRDNNKYKLLAKDKYIYLDISYEIDELEKDIFFLQNNFEDFYDYLDKLNDNFKDQVVQGVEYLKQHVFLNFITDRDGTVNNYCGRYSSSIQSIYNSVFLTKFAKKCTGNSVLLTSAPLENPGMINVSINPKNSFIYAASKGREYYDKDGNRKEFPIDRDKQSKLDQLNINLNDLLKDQKYNIFTLIGSGLQFKYGQTTIAYQDIYKSISKNDSKDFLNKMYEVVRNTDPYNKYFRTEETGKDLEIILTIDGQDNKEQKDFDKGDGLLFLDKDIGLSMKKGPNLICGDTNSDVPMVQTSMSLTENTFTIFVTERNKLIKKIKEICSNSYFVTKPDTLVMILNILADGV